MKRFWSVFVLIIIVLALMLCLFILIQRGSVRFQAGKTESQSSLVSASGSSASDNATFSAKHVVFIRASENPLMERVSASLVRQLTNCALIGKLSVVDSERDLADGTEAPDLFIRLTSHGVTVRGVFSSSVAARVSCSLGTNPYQSSHSSYGDSSAPVVRFHWNAMADHNSKFAGVRSDRLAEVADSLARDFGKGISNQIKELSGKYSPVPELPRSFYGPYEPVAELQALKALKTTRVYSHFGLLTHNETFWTFQTPPAFSNQPALQRLVADLESEGWKTSHASLTNTHAPGARFTRSDAELELFRIDRFYADISAPDTNTWRWVVHYQKPFSRIEREAALETLLAANAPVDKLLPFRNNLSPAQQKRFFAALETAPARSSRTCLYLAEHFLQQRRTNDAVQMLVRAEALSPAAPDRANLSSAINQQAGKISRDLRPEQSITPELCRELGFIELTNGSRIEVERELGKPALLFHRDSKLRRMAFFIDPPQGNQYPWKFVSLEDGVSSQTSSFLQFPGTAAIPQSLSFGTNQVQVRSQLTPDARAVKLAFEM